MFGDVSKLVLRGRGNIFATISEHALHLFGFFVAGEALWTCPASLAGAALQTCRLPWFLQIASAGLREVVTKCKLRGRRGILCDMMKFGGSLARNINFEVANLRLLVRTPGKTSIVDLQLVKIAGSLAQNAPFEVSTCLVRSLCLRRVYGGSLKPVVVHCVKVSKLEDVSHEVLV